MKFVQAQFSLKYEPKLKIRRCVNDIEDFLQQYYGTPQTMPLPDEFAHEAPRIVLYSKNGHSQISFSQISVDFTVRFDNEFLYEFDKTKDYIQNRINLIIELLKKIEINEYLFCGVSYLSHLEIGEQSPIDYIKQYLGGDIPQDELYEASQRIVTLKDDRYFVNQQVGTYKEFNRVAGIMPSLFEKGSGSIVSEGVSLVLDINGRYRYVYHNTMNPIDTCAKDVNRIFLLLEETFRRWE